MRRALWTRHVRTLLEGRGGEMECMVYAAYPPYKYIEREIFIGALHVHVHV